ncbi:unnamed protein product [Penicillium nalgiovense]|nr:unnamed protein product [Penicillium nalgiovense]
MLFFSRHLHHRAFSVSVLRSSNQLANFKPPVSPPTIKMKFTSVVVAVIAAGTVQAAATTPSETLPKWCGHIGQGCKRTTDASMDVKRSADALAEAMAGGLPLVLQKWCGHIGQGCYKAKRAADAVDEVKRTSDALARAFAALEEEDDQ